MQTADSADEKTCTKFVMGGSTYNNVTCIQDV